MLDELINDATECQQTLINVSRLSSAIFYRARTKYNDINTITFSTWKKIQEKKILSRDYIMISRYGIPANVFGTSQINEIKLPWFHDFFSTNSVFFLMDRDHKNAMRSAATLVHFSFAGAASFGSLVKVNLCLHFSHGWCKISYSCMNAFAINGI